MKLKLTLRLVLALLFCSCYSLLVAQTDSSWLDLGRIKLKKEFTQTVTIKGKDLEQMPFGNLSEAIDVWLYGQATNSNTVTYVIDGLLLTDVNVYSIHDIEEITLVQNALVQLNGATMARQLLLITTRKNRDKKQGLNIAGSSFAVSNSFQDSGPDKQEGQTNYYHRYYVSAYQNRQNIQYGLSATYLRDVFPYPDNGYKIEKPYQVNRIALNGYMNARLGTNNSVWLRTGFIPSRFRNVAFTSNYGEWDVKNRQTIFTAEAGWQSRFIQHFTNELSAGITPVKDKGESVVTNDIIYITPPFTRVEHKNTKPTFNNLLITDHLTYETSVGDWNIAPSVNVSYRHIKSDNSGNSSVVNTTTGTVFFDTSYANGYKMDVLLLTPAVDLSYKDLFNVQGGLVYNLSKEQPGDADKKKSFPFITTGINISKWAWGDRKLKWKIFGSWAHAGNFADMNFQLQDVNSFITSWPFPTLPASSNGGMVLLYGNDEHNTIVQIGTRIGKSNDRLQLSYNFEKRKYSDSILIYSRSQGRWFLYKLDANSTVHRFGITAKVLDKASWNWMTALNVSGVTGIFKIQNSESTQKETILAAGWINRFQFKKIIVGLDILLTSLDGDNWNVMFDDDYGQVSFKNIYVGYRTQLGNNTLELYAATRNPGRKNESYLPDRRNYFGLGGKLEL
jgi:hypothetical protein